MAREMMGLGKEDFIRPCRPLEDGKLLEGFVQVNNITRLHFKRIIPNTVLITWQTGKKRIRETVERLLHFS